MTILWVGENHFGSTLVDGSWVRFLPFPALVCFMILCPCKSNQSLLVCSDFNNSLPLYVHAQVARIKSQKKKKGFIRAARLAIYLILAWTMLVGAGIYTSRSYHAISALKARRMASNRPSFLILHCSLFRNTVLYLEWKGMLDAYQTFKLYI